MAYESKEKLMREIAKGQNPNFQYHEEYERCMIWAQVEFSGETHDYHQFKAEQYLWKTYFGKFGSFPGIFLGVNKPRFHKHDSGNIRSPSCEDKDAGGYRYASQRHEDPSQHPNEDRIRSLSDHHHKPPSKAADAPPRTLTDRIQGLSL